MYARRIAGLFLLGFRSMRATPQLPAAAAKPTTIGTRPKTGAEQLSDVRRVLISVYRVQAVLADHGYGTSTQSVARHPHHLFAALRDFYLEAVVLQGKSLEAWPLRYQHEDLRACFEQLARGLARGLTVPTVVSPRLPFQRDEYWFFAGPFPEELRSASEVFLLLERAPQAPVTEDSAPPVVDDIKLASRLRAEEVYTKALEGVPRRSIPSLGFAQTFGHRATVFQLDTRSREWSHADIRDRDHERHPVPILRRRIGFQYLRQDRKARFRTAWWADQFCERRRGDFDGGTVAADGAAHLRRHRI